MSAANDTANTFSEFQRRLAVQRREIGRLRKRVAALEAGNDPGEEDAPSTKEQIRHDLEASELTQRAIADKHGVSEAYVSQLKSG